MLDWLHHVAAWASPIVTILAIPTAIVTFVVTLRRVRRWVDRQLVLWTRQQAAWTRQQAVTKASAVAAARSAGSAEEASRATLQHASSASTQSYIAANVAQHADEGIGIIAGHIGDALDEVRGNGRVDELLAEILRLRILLDTNGIAIPGDEPSSPDPAEPEPEPQPEPDSTDEITSTGRHRLRGFTEAIQIVPEGDPE